MFKSRIRRRRFASHIGGYSYTPRDIAKAYSFPADYDGSGQTIGILSLGGGFKQSVLTQYFSALGVSPKAVEFVGLLGATNQPGDPNGPDGENYLDLEVIGAMVPGAQIIFYSAPNSNEGYQAIVDQAVADNVTVLSSSWGSDEANWQGVIGNFNADYSSAYAKKIYNTAAAGDNGSGDGDSGNNVDFPASSPNVLACGGTSLIYQNGVIKQETVWNDGSQGGATGGGVSTVFNMLGYQNGVGVPGGKSRGVPDVAGNADPDTGWIVSIDGQQGVIGGTSAVAPMWAAIIAILTQANGSRLSDLHAFLYANAATFRDIMVGNNGTYAAKKGYDCCTGLGSPNVSKLIAALGSGSTPKPPTVPPPPVVPTSIYIPKVGTYNWVSS